MTKARVSIVKLEDFGNDASRAVAEAIRLLNPLPFDVSGKVLVKPNLVGKNLNACTSKEVIKGVINWAEGRADELWIGDSPGAGIVEDGCIGVLRWMDLLSWLEGKGVKVRNFDGERVHHVSIPGAGIMESNVVADAVVQCDVLINVPRAKSHLHTLFTGAVKNYWGIVPGGLKAKRHGLGAGKRDGFAKVLRDNFMWVIQNKRRRLVVMDCTSVMTGVMGPSWGVMKEWGLILAGNDEVAVDTVALAIGRINAMESIGHLRECHMMKLGTGDLSEIEIIGEDLKRVLKDKFQLPSSGLAPIVTLADPLVMRFFQKVPKLITSRCLRCGDCYSVCPAEPEKAIEWHKGETPRFLTSRCIGCFCCAEMCRGGAIRQGYLGLRGIFDYFAS